MKGKKDGRASWGERLREEQMRRSDKHPRWKERTDRYRIEDRIEAIVSIDAIEEIEDIEGVGQYNKEKQKKERRKEMNYTGTKCLVRTNRAGVFYGTIKEYDKTTREMTIAGCRRIWKWVGAASLSQMAVEGVKNKEESRFTMAVDEMCVMDVIEVIPCTEKAQKIIESVKEWKV